jgi:uncharacterized protein YjbJ (UPF0337 family)
MSSYPEPESSGAIKADIEQTRAEMSAKIDQLQQKLDPSRLKEQAQETVRDFLTESSNSVMDYVRTNRKEISSSVVDAVKRNPVPSALIALGLGWLLVESMSSSERGQYDYRRDPRYYRPPDVDRWRDDGGQSTMDREGYAGGQGYYPSGQSAQSGWSDSQIGRQETNGHNVVQEVKQQAQEVARAAGEKAGEAVDAVRSAASNLGEQVGARIGEMGGQARDRAGQFGHQVGQQVGERGQALGMQARQAGRQMGRQIEHQMEDSPLLMGALAFAAGAAVAMLLPPTRAENRMLGDTRDQIVDQVKGTAQELAHEVADRAQRVVEEVKPELEQTARKVVEDVKQTGKEAAQELQGTMQKTQEKVKQEASEVVETGKSKLQSTTTTGQTGQAATGQSSQQGNISAAGAPSTKSISGSSSQGSSVIPANWETVKGQWTQWKGEAKRKWGKLTDDDLTRIEGDYEKLVGAIQEKYSYSRSQAEQEVGNFSRSGLTSR